MLKRVIGAFSTHPTVHRLMKDLVSMQLEDVGGMLQLPLSRPDAQPRIEIRNGCNFAVTAVLCNIVSGISLSFFAPRKLTKISDEGRVRWIDTDKPFKELLDRYFPWPAAANTAVKNEAGQILYNICRTSFAHSLGVHGDSTMRINIVRHRSDRGLTADEVKQVEESATRPAWLQPSFIGTGKHWQLIADGLYRDVLDMVCNLGADSEQMKATESRFVAGKIIWRSGNPVA